MSLFRTSKPRKKERPKFWTKHVGFVHKNGRFPKNFLNKHEFVQKFGHYSPFLSKILDNIYKLTPR